MHCRKPLSRRTVYQGPQRPFPRTVPSPGNTDFQISASAHTPSPTDTRRVFRRGNSRRHPHCLRHCFPSGTFCPGTSCRCAVDFLRMVREPHSDKHPPGGRCRMCSSSGLSYRLICFLSWIWGTVVCTALLILYADGAWVVNEGWCQRKGQGILFSAFVGDPDRLPVICKPFAPFTIFRTCPKCYSGRADTSACRHFGVPITSAKDSLIRGKQIASPTKSSDCIA